MGGVTGKLPIDWETAHAVVGCWFTRAMVTNNPASLIKRTQATLTVLNPWKPTTGGGVSPRLTNRRFSAGTNNWRREAPTNQQLEARSAD